MNTLTVIAVCGRAGAGKDAFAKPFMDEGFVCVKFASALKRTIRTLFPSASTLEHTDGHLKDVVIPELGASPRELMQYIGTDLLQLELGRRFPAIGRKIFCGSTIAEMMGTHERCIITDLRFTHEYDALVEATTRHCARLYVVRVQRGDHQVAGDHVSESEYLQIPVDAVVQNAGGVEELHRRGSQMHADVIAQQREWS